MHREDLIRGHLRTAKLIALRMAHALNGDREEFESAAYLGLVEAASRYDPAKNDNFERWADRRIRGAILDYLQHQSRLPKEERARRRADPNRVNTGPVFHTYRVDFTEAENLPGSSEDPLLAFAKRDVRRLLDLLPTGRNHRVMGLYYVDGLTDRQIGALCGITEFRVCQIRKLMCTKLRELLRERGIGFDDLW